MWSDLHCLANSLTKSINFNRNPHEFPHKNNWFSWSCQLTTISWFKSDICVSYDSYIATLLTTDNGRLFPINFRILTMVCRGCFNLPPSPLHKLFPWYNIQSKIISVCTIQHSCTLDFPSMRFYFHRQVPVQLWVNITTHLIHTHWKASSKLVPETTQSKPHLQTHTHGNLRWTPSGPSLCWRAELNGANRDKAGGEKRHNVTIYLCIFPRFDVQRLYCRVPKHAV